MASVLLGENTVNLVGELPAVGSQAPEFSVTGIDFKDIDSDSLRGQRVILNIFPTIDTGVCSASEREFNKRAETLENGVIVSVSKDLPLSLKNFCAAEGIEKVVPTSAFRSSFGEDFGVTFADGAWKGLLARSVVVLDETGKVVYTELVPVTGQEPNYDAAIDALS